MAAVVAESRRSPRQVADLVATVVLVVVGALWGIGYGFLALVFTPNGAAAVWWVVLSVLMAGAPVVTAIVGFRRIVAGRTGFWMPLLGLGLVAALVGILSLLSSSLVPAAG